MLGDMTAGTSALENRTWQMSTCQKIQTKVVLEDLAQLEGLVGGCRALQVVVGAVHCGRDWANMVTCIANLVAWMSQQC